MMMGRTTMRNKDDGEDYSGSCIATDGIFLCLLENTDDIQIGSDESPNVNAF